jgi:hypothetical protein
MSRFVCARMHFALLRADKSGGNVNASDGPVRVLVVWIKVDF